MAVNKLLVIKEKQGTTEPMAKHIICEATRVKMAAIP